MSGKYTEEELNGLSETERDALNASEDENDDETLADIAGEDGDDDSDDGSDDDVTDEDQAAIDAAAVVTADAAAVAAAAALIAAGDDKGAAVVVPPVASDEFDFTDIPAVSFVPVLTGEVLPEYEEKIVALDAKLEDGEITAAIHRKEVRKLEAASQNEEVGKQLWAAQQAAFLQANKDFAPATNPAEYARLNKEVIRVANDPATANLTGIQILYVAKNNLTEAAEFAEFRAQKAATKKAGVAVVKAADDKPVIPAKPSAKRPDIQTLRDVPAADGADVGQDKFAHLDKLSGVALESAIAKLTPAEHDAYLAGA